MSAPTPTSSTAKRQNAEVVVDNNNSGGQGSKKKKSKNHDIDDDDEVEEVEDTKTTTKKSPYDVWSEERKAFFEGKDYLGYMLIKGVEKERNGDDEEEDDEEDDDEDEDDDDDDPSKYTQEQVDRIRIVPVTKNLDTQLEKMRTLVLGDQAQEEFCFMFTTRFSYHVLGTWRLMKPRLAKLKPTPKLYTLFAYTKWIHEFDVWMHDNEGGMGTLVKGLASAWKRLLSKNSDEDLGLDSTYSKPAVLEQAN